MSEETADAGTHSILSSITTWSSRLAWLISGVALGATVTALVDSRSGPQRRRELKERGGALARRGARELRQQAEYAAQAAVGAALETAKEVVPETLRSPEDPKTLRQRIRSEVIGQAANGDDVVVVVHDAGQVTLKGTVASSDIEQELVEATRRVPGVTQVVTQLTVRS